MSFYIFAWISLFAYAISTVLEKLVANRLIKNLWWFSFLSNFFILAILTGIMLFRGFSPVYDWANIIYSGIFWGLGNIFFYLALYHVDLTVLSPAFNIKGAIALLLGIFFLHEQISGLQWFLIGLILISGFFIFYDEGVKFKAFFKKSTFFVFADFIFLAINNVFVNKALASTDFWTVTFFMQLIALGTLLFMIPYFKNEIQQTTIKQYAITFFITILSTVGLIAGNKAISGDIGIPNIIISIPLAMVLVMVLSIFYPRLLEHHPFRVYVVRFLAAAVMFAAAIKLTV